MSYPVHSDPRRVKLGDVVQVERANGQVFNGLVYSVIHGRCRSDHPDQDLRCPPQIGAVVVVTVGPLGNLSQFAGLRHTVCRTPSSLMWWR